MQMRVIYINVKLMQNPWLFLNVMQLCGINVMQNLRIIDVTRESCSIIKIQKLNKKPYYSKLSKTKKCSFWLSFFSKVANVYFLMVYYYRLIISWAIIHLAWALAYWIFSNMTEQQIYMRFLNFRIGKLFLFPFLCKKKCRRECVSLVETFKRNF